MIKHIFMWKIRPRTGTEGRTFLGGPRGVDGGIPHIREQEVCVNCVPGNYDAALISVFDSLADLEAYKTDPRHVKVSTLCKAIRTDRVAVDCEV